MTTPTKDREEESADRTSDDWPGVGRRPLLTALSAGAALSVGSGVATAGGDEADDDRVDQAEGFEAEVVAPHATFPDDVAAAFGVGYEDGAEDSAILHDASTVIVVRARLEPGGTSGWHIERGPAIVSVVEGEADVTFAGEDGCVTRTYAAGEAFVATGNHADLVENASDAEPAMAYIIVLGVPDGEPPSASVDPPDC
ncbi:cupin domain-containing protein [Halorarum salinum]|uniref:Cupin domain-containing protein n=1 Tax=Halorarum salinum TaxID=2743089 RepID=A0A7D5Q7Z8_9EURY|nr:cupin domain-containing protein [Halobaculum salinum]QLG60456.1 cupin domain-containing protein [Halobaculum salinum]